LLVEHLYSILIASLLNSLPILFTSMSNDAMLLVAFFLVNWKVNFDIRSLGLMSPC